MIERDESLIFRSKRNICGRAWLVYNIDLSYRRMKIEAELNSQWWRIKSGEVAFQANHGSIGSRRSRLSLLRVNCYIYYCEGQATFIVIVFNYFGAKFLEGPGGSLS